MVGMDIICRCRRSLCRVMVAAVLLVSAAALQATAGEVKLLQKSDIGEIIDTLTTAFERYYVYPDTAQALSDYIHKRFKEGAYDLDTVLTLIVADLRNDMRSFTHDKHVSISIMSSDDYPAIGDTVTDAEKMQSARDNFGIRDAEWLTGNVGYVRFDRFEDVEYAGDATTAAMNFVARCDAVIIDLRYNGGGEETMVKFLASYFFKRQTMINSLYFPRNDSLRQSWTSSYVPGHKMVNTDLYILISQMTASGAEAFTYGMKNAGRAVVIGETSAGAAHWTEYWDFPGLQIRASIPIARPINPVTKTSWERTGVKPDIEVPSFDALTVAHAEAIKKLMTRTTDDKRRTELTWALAGVEAQMEPSMLSPEMIRSYTGDFANGHYTVFTHKNILLIRYPDGTEFELIPLSKDLFGFDDSDDYRVEFIRNQDGRVSGYRILALGREPGSVKERTGDIK